MENQKDRHKKIQCKVCGRCVRSDHMKRHARTHQDILTMSEDEAREELRRRNDCFLEREEKFQKLEEIAQQEEIDISNCIETQSTPVTTQSLEEELLKENQEHLDKLELGKQIARIINKGTVLEESLSRDRKHALDLYRKQKPTINIRKAHLRVWQHQLLQLIKKPLKREVYWICGYNGNEGKSWFQDYIETRCGYARVARLDLRNKTSNILFTLSKRPLQSTDIFLFNDTRATDSADQNYSVLEQIKDGNAISSKYSSTVLKFKVPNMVIVFSNSQPNKSKLSSDRWIIFSIKKGELNRKS